LPELEFKRPVFEFLDDRGVDRKVHEARELGREHGRVGVPGPNHLEAPQVNAYADEAERSLGQISRDWHEMNRVLRGEWCRLRHQLPGRKQQLPAAKTAVKRAERREEEKRRLYDERLEAARAAPRGTRHRIGRIPYVLGLAAVFLIDVPLNSVVFQIFGESQLATWLLAAFLGILIVPGAHLLGIQLRNGFPDKVATALATVVPLGVTFAIAILRARFLDEDDADLRGSIGVLLFFLFNLAVFCSRRLPFVPPTRPVRAGTRRGRLRAQDRPEGTGG
jgi:hypothetical protein